MRPAKPEWRPAAVFSMGGYVAGPPVLAALLRGVPLVVMEPNAVPGFTNRRLALFVDAAAVSFDESLKYFRGKGVVIGNPVRREFFEIGRKERDPARFSLAHGGKDGHPFPVPLDVYDETIRVLTGAVSAARLGNDEKLAAIRRLDAQARALERARPS